MIAQAVGRKGGERKREGGGSTKEKERESTIFGAAATMEGKGERMERERTEVKRREGIAVGLRRRKRIR